LWVSLWLDEFHDHAARISRYYRSRTAALRRFSFAVGDDADLQLEIFGFPFQPQPYEFAFTFAQPLAALAIVLVAAMNYLGVRTVGRFQVFLTGLKLAAIGLILGLGFAAKNPIAIDRSVFTLSHGAVVAFLTALVPVMAAYNGFQGLGPLGGEVLNPRRNLPRAAILETSLVIVVYLLINWMYFHLLSFSQVAHSQHIASDVVAVLIGQAGAK